MTSLFRVGLCEEDATAETVEMRLWKKSRLVKIEQQGIWELSMTFVTFFKQILALSSNVKWEIG